MFKALFRSVNFRSLCGQFQNYNIPKMFILKITLIGATVTKILVFNKNNLCGVFLVTRSLNT
jgi:hypothetical protein